MPDSPALRHFEPYLEIFIKKTEIHHHQHDQNEDEKPRDAVSFRYPEFFYMLFDVTSRMPECRNTDKKFSLASLLYR
jgi:hypothetical protein